MKLQRITNTSRNKYPISIVARKRNANGNELGERNARRSLHRLISSRNDSMVSIIEVYALQLGRTSRGNRHYASRIVSVETRRDRSDARSVILVHKKRESRVQTRVPRVTLSCLIIAANR